MFKPSMQAKSASAALATSAVAAMCVALAAPVSAHDNECNVSVNHDVTVNKDYMRVFEGDKTLFKINTDGSLWVDGKAIDLDDKHQAISRKYVNEVQDLVPEVYEVVSDALSVSGKAIGASLNEAFGEGNELGASIQSALQRASEKLDETIAQDGESYTLSEDNFNGIDDAFGEEFEQEIEQAVENSLGAILMTMGKAMMSGEGDFESRMEAFGQRMEAFGERMETDMEGMAEGLEAKGEKLCMRMHKADSLEQQLQAAVPALAAYDLIQPES